MDNPELSRNGIRLYIDSTISLIITRKRVLNPVGETDNSLVQQKPIVLSLEKGSISSKIVNRIRELKSEPKRRMELNQQMEAYNKNISEFGLRPGFKSPSWGDHGVLEGRVSRWESVLEGGISRWESVLEGGISRWELDWIKACKMLTDELKGKKPVDVTKDGHESVND